MVVRPPAVSKPGPAAGDVTPDPRRWCPIQTLPADTGSMKRRKLQRHLLESISTIGISRHTAVPALRRVSNSSAGSFSRQLLSLMTGAVLIGVAVTLLVNADLGLPPYDVMTSAMSQRLGLSLGQSGWLLAGVLFAVATVFGHRPSPWGIAYVLAIGVAIDAASGLLVPPDTLAGRWCFVAASIVLLATGVSLVVYSGTTGGPFELLMLAGEDRNIDRTRVRYGLDLGVLASGIMLGGSFGPATIAYALTFGLVLRVIGQILVDHGDGRRARLEGTALSGAAVQRLEAGEFIR